MGDSNEKVVLLDFWPSMFGMRLRVALAEKGVKYESIEEDITRGKSQLLVEMNPVHKKIPVLIHNGRPIGESMIAVQYIDQVWNHKPSLLPLDPYERVCARFWVDYIDKKVYEAGKKIYLHKTDENVEEARNEFLEIFKLLEAQLGDKSYYGGENFGFLDIALITFYSWFYTYETLGKFKLEDECPKLVEWAKRCMTKQSVSSSLPDQYKVYEFILELRKRVGVE